VWLLTGIMLYDSISNYAISVNLGHLTGLFTGIWYMMKFLAMQFLWNYGYFTGSVHDRLMCTPDGSTSISTFVVMFLCKPVAEKCV
jgi:hypothetical protein